MKTYAKLISCVLILPALLLFSGVNPLVVTKSVVVLAIQISIGAWILGLLWVKRGSSPPGLFAGIGIAFILGAITLVVVDQIVIRYELAGSVLYTAIVALFISGVISNLSSLTPKKISAGLVEIRPITILLLITAALSMLLSSWYWLIPAMPFLIIGFLLSQQKYISFKQAKFFGASSVLLAIALLVDQSRKRPEFWSVHHLHYQFDEALNISFSKFGIFENMMAVGEPLKYHWFSHAWIGMLSRLTGADDWVAATRVMPIVASILIACLAFGIGQKLTGTVTGGSIVAAVLAISPVFHVISPEVSWVMTTSHSQFFGILFILAFVYVFISSETTPKVADTLLLSVLLAATTVTKVNHAIILGAGFTVVVLFAIFRNRTLRVRLFAHYLIVVAPTFLAFLLSQGVSSSSGARIGFIPVAAQMSGDFKNMVGIRRELIAIYFLVGVFGLSLILVAISLANSLDLENHFAILVASAALTGLFISLLVDFGVDGRQVYFWHSASVLVWLMAGHVIYQTFAIRRKSHSWRPVVLISGLSVFLFFALSALPNLNSGSDIAALLRSTSSNSAVAFPVILGSVLLFSFLRFNKVSHNSRQTLTDYLVLSIAATTAVYFISTHLTRFNDDYRSVESESTEIVVPDDLQLIGNWFADNTQDEVIVASNSFCESSNCAEQNLKIFSTIGDPEYRLSGSSTDYRMAVAVKRRFLITSFTFLSSDGKLQDWAVDRIRLARDFGSMPTQELLLQLREFDVQYFISDAEVKDVSDWDRFGSIVYTVGRYKIIDLESSS